MAPGVGLTLGAKALSSFAIAHPAQLVKLIITSVVMIIWAPLKTVLPRDCCVSRVLTAFGAHKLGVLHTVRPHVLAHTLRFSARGLLALTKNSWFLEVPICFLILLPCLLVNEWKFWKILAVGEFSGIIRNIWFYGSYRI